MAQSGSLAKERPSAHTVGRVIVQATLSCDRVDSSPEHVGAEPKRRGNGGHFLARGFVSCLPKRAVFTTGLLRMFRNGETVNQAHRCGIAFFFLPLNEIGFHSNQPLVPEPPKKGRILQQILGEH